MRVVVNVDRNPLDNTPTNGLIEVDPEDLEKVFKPEYIQIMKDHLNLQMKWRTVVSRAGIDIYEGEFMSIDWLAEAFKDKVFWDIGCSKGLWSIAALVCGARKVYGFDPLPENYVPYNDRFTRFKTKIGKEPSIDFIATTTLSKPDIIKIDVEGDELKVLRGAKRTLKKYRPILVVEAHEILFSNEPKKRKVTGNKQKIIDLLKPILGEPSEIIDQNVKAMGVIYHLIYVPKPLLE